jgi:hypothetical protein
MKYIHSKMLAYFLFVQRYHINYINYAMSNRYPARRILEIACVFGITNPQITRQCHLTKQSVH